MYSAFLFIGHRGTRTDFDENTFTAFFKSIEYGANCIEFDVRKTKDKKLVILHDPTLDRTTNCKGDLTDFTFRELKEVQTKISKNHIPLLSEVLEKLKEKTTFMIELKDEDIVEEVLQTVKIEGVMEDVIFSSRYLKDLIKIKKKDPSSRICFNITKGEGLTLEEFMNINNIQRKHVNLDFISLKSNLISKDFIDLCHKNKIKSLSWNFLNYENPENKLRSLTELGIDGILFDNYKNIPKIKKYLHLL
ncbi:MAG: glycerophosphodiester phosphodiesterase [Candidatus Thorarchaeota archaeon]